MCELPLNHAVRFRKPIAGLLGVPISSPCAVEGSVSAPMKQFVLIDHPTTGNDSQRYEYARRVLEAAEGAGYVAHLATSRDDLLRDFGGAPVRPVHPMPVSHPRESKGVAPLPRRTSDRIRGRLFALKLAVLFSGWGEIWSHRHDSLDLLRRARCAPMRERLKLITGFIIFWGWATLCDTGRILKAAVPCRNYLQRVHAEARQAARRALQPAMIVLRRPRAVAAWLFGERKNNGFAARVRRLIEQLSLGPDDVVFVPNVEPSEVLGFRRLFEQLPAAREPTWHLLFRRNIYTGRDPDYDAADEHLRGLRNAFLHLREGLQGARVYCYTDTVQLTDQYNRLGIVPFATLPIPVDAAYHNDRFQVTGEEPLSIVYAGDARTERGYHLLPRVVQDVWHDCVLTGQAKFRVQSKFNVAGGDCRAIVARAQLAAFDDGKLQILHEPLASEAYRELVVQAGLMLVLHDRDGYYARSSGVFAEAMAAGVPVVAPAGSWMALQLSEDIYAYHQSLLRHPEIACTELDGALQNWRSQGVKKGRPLPDERLDLGGDAARDCLLDVPAENNYLLVTFRDRSSTAGNFVHVAADFTGECRSQKHRVEAIVGGHREGTASALFPVPCGADGVRLAFRGALTDKTITLGDVRFYFLRSSAELPRSAVGVVYAEMGEIAHALREVVRHHRHYRETARQRSVSWAAYHEPGNLIGRLLDRAGLVSESPDRSSDGVAQYSSSAFPREKVA